MSFLSIFAQDLAIDLGTTNTLVFKQNKGLILNEPTRVAVDINNGQVVAIGTNAQEMTGKTPTNIVIFSALEGGVIKDYEITRTMVKYFLDKAISGIYLLSPRVVVSVPTGITDIERRAVEDAVIQAGARDVLLIEEPLASITGARSNSFEPIGNMVVNFGGGITEIAVTSLGRIVTASSIRLGGESINSELVKFVEENYGLLIGPTSAEEMKLAIASLDRSKEERKYDLVGRDMVTGLPNSVSISSKDLIPILESNVIKIIDRIRDVLERTPPELTSNIIESGILLTGGSSKLDGLQEFLMENLGLPVDKDEEPMTSTVVGSGAFIARFAEIKKTRIRKHG